MPNLPVHLDMALKVREQLDDPDIDSYLGCFLLGSTTPDIRAMTKGKREDTHFAPLATKKIGTGAEGLFGSHPELADRSKLGPATGAFLAGYLSHLAADETWIMDIYQRYFDGHSMDQQEMQANIWDRALQLDMDRAAMDDMGDREEIRRHLQGSEEEVDIGFLDGEQLAQWREWVVKFTTWDFTWERLRFATRRMYRDDADAARIAEDFLLSMPDSLEEVYGLVPKDKIATYRDKAIAESVRMVKEYLGEPANS